MKDSGTHFDKSIVDVFLAIPLVELIQVFLSESPEKMLLAKDLKVLSDSCLLDVYNALNAEKPTKKQQKLIEVFEFYYACKNGAGEE